MCVPHTALSVTQWLYQRADSSLPTHIAREKQLGVVSLWQTVVASVWAGDGFSETEEIRKGPCELRAAGGVKP